MKTIITGIQTARNTIMPITVVDCEREKAQLLVCVHGFKANRTEDGRFLTVAKALAENGISSIMMGFAGCDVSGDDFFNYTLDNCLSDIDTGINYMHDHYDLKDTLGMIGYSMGGRLVSLCIARYDIKCLGIWAGACFTAFNNNDKFLGGNIEDMKKEANEKGYCDFYNAFDGQTIKLNRRLLENMEEYDPAACLKEYSGSCIVVHGNQDITVYYPVALNTYASLEKAEVKKLVTVNEADHGFGAWNNRPDLSTELTDSTIEFFRENYCE